MPGPIIFRLHMMPTAPFNLKTGLYSWNRSLQIHTPHGPERTTCAVRPDGPEYKRPAVKYQVLNGDKNKIFSSPYIGLYIHKAILADTF